MFSGVLKVFRRLVAYTLLMGALLGGVILVSQPTQAAAGINQQMNFQGRLLNAQGATVPDGSYNIEFKIYQDGDGQTAGDTTGTPAGVLKWTEDHLNAASQGVVVKNGFMSVQLGSVTPFGSSIDWNQDTLWLSMNIAGTNGTCTPFSSCTPDGEMVPMKRLSSSPYSINSGLLGGLASSQFLQLAQGLQTDATANTSININKTGTGNFLALQSSGTAAFTLTGTGDVTLGSNANHTVSIAAAPASSAGRTLTVVAGAAGGGTGVLNGGDLVLQGGGGTGGGVSGSVVIASNGSNSTTALQVKNAAGSAVLAVDTTTGSVNFLGTPTASATSSVLQIGSPIQGGSANGTYLGLNAPSGYAGNLLDLQVNGVSQLAVSSVGVLNAKGGYSVGSATVINGTGILQNASLSGTYGSALTFTNTTNNYTGVGTGLTALNASSVTRGILGIGYGGTGVTSFNAYGVVFADSTAGTLQSTVAGTNNQCLIGVTNANPQWGSCPVTAGSGNYVQNGTALQVAANFNIQSASSGSVVGVLVGAVGQSRDLFQLKNSGGDTLSSFDQNGQLTVGRIATTGTTQAGTITVSDGTLDGFGAKLKSAILTANQSIALPNESGTICLQSSANCGFLTGSAASGSYVSLQAATPGTPQTGNLNISGAGILGTGLSVGTTDKSATLRVAGTGLLSTTSATAFQIQDASNNTLLNLDTSASQGSLYGSFLVGGNKNGGGAGTSLYNENFDGTGTWTVGNNTACAPWTWRANSTGTTAHSPSKYWAFGNGTTDGYGINCTGGVDSYSYSPAITLSTTQTNQLSLWYELNLQEIGTTYDRAFIEIVSAATPTTILSSDELTTNQASWTQFTKNLDPSWGAVRVRVRIYTADNVNNTGFGFRVDDVAVNTIIPGNKTPKYQLDVQGTQDASYITRIQNYSTTTTADGLLIDLGISDGSRAGSNYFIGFSGGGTVAGKIQGTANGVAYTTTGADYAEYFKADMNRLPKSGELVSISGPQSVRLAQGNSAPLVGVVSTSPGFIGNGPLCNASDKMCDSNYALDNVLVGLSGQVPTKVSVKNGVINPGDPIGPSDTPGVAQKVTSCQIVGYALSSARSDGLITVLVRPGFYNPTAGSNLQGGGDGNVANLTVTNQLTSGTLAIAGKATLGSLTVNNDATFKGNLAVSGTVSVHNILIAGHVTTGGAAPKVKALGLIGSGGKVTIAGNDSSGTITITTDDLKSLKTAKTMVGNLATVQFATPFDTVPQVVLTPANADAAKLQYYYDGQSATSTGFDIGTNTPPLPNTTYTYTYFVIQSKDGVKTP